MTTVLIFSDTHGMPIPGRIMSVAAESDAVIFLGDGISGLGDLLYKKGLHMVLGNGDYPYPGIKTEQVLELGGIKIFICHGNTYRVKYDLLPLALRAKELGCSYAFYGHTHTAQIDEYDGVTLICPGSPTCPHGSSASYVYAVAHEGKLTCKIVEL